MQAKGIGRQGFVNPSSKLRFPREGQVGRRKGPATSIPGISVDEGPIVRLPELAIVGLNVSKCAEATSVTGKAGAWTLDYSVRSYALDAGQQHRRFRY